MRLLHSSAALLALVLVACVNAGVLTKVLDMEEDFPGMPRLPHARADDLCAQKQAASQYCRLANGTFDGDKCSQSVVTAWLFDYDSEAQNVSYFNREAQWKYSTNITDETMANANAASQYSTEWFVQKMIEAMRFPKERYDAATAAQLTRITTTNSLCADTEITREIELDSALAEGYSSISACYDPPVGCLTGQSAFATEMSKTEDYDKLRKLWEDYTNGAKPFRRDFIERLGLLNKGARENGWPDNGYYEWFTDVGDEDFIAKMKALLKEIEPLYIELHAYVRYKLAQKYPGKVDLRKAIPVHLTRNMYGQTWGDLIGLVKPYPSVPDTDITPQLQAQNYTTDRIFRLSEEFFASIGAYNMTDIFWEKSMLERPADGRLVECHGSAWDMQIKDDYRIKMCTIPNMAEFTTVHHEMGHVEYYQAYRPQLYIYRDDSQSGFHEAIGDTITLSVLTPEHLYAVKLLDEIPEGTEFDINFLMTMALDKLPFFSFALMMDLWRWGTYNGSITDAQYNSEWWRMRYEMGGIVPPAESDRGSEEFFDPGAKYHVTNNVPYIRYFMSFFLQFQFYESMCKEAGNTRPLHRCDFYNSKAAGKKLLDLMKQGRSTNWHDQLQEMTGTREISSGPILAYFKPLQDWLKADNDKNGLYRGWTDDSTTVAPTSQTQTPAPATTKDQGTTVSEGPAATTSGATGFGASASVLLFLVGFAVIRQL